MKHATYTTDQSLDLLAVAPHPDDAELFCGGTIALMSSRGYRTGIVDCSRGELSSQGTIDERAKESSAAATLLGLAHRENLGLPDGDINEHDRAQLRPAVALLRRLRPKLLLLPYWIDRHPDHRSTSELFSRAAFHAALRMFAPELGVAHAASGVLYYPLRTPLEPSFIVDISTAVATKMSAIGCYQSQILRRDPSHGSPVGTVVSSPLSVSSLRARDNYYGAMIGVEAGEGFLTKGVLPLPDPVKTFTEFPQHGNLFMRA